MKLILLVLITVVAQGLAQRSCFICNNCNDPFNTGDHERHVCNTDNMFWPPGQEPTPTEDPNSTTSLTLTPPSDGPPQDEPTTTYPGTPTTTVQGPTAATQAQDVPLYRRRRQAVEETPVDPVDTNPFRCFIAHREVGGNRQTQRGCVAYMAEDTCALLGVSGDNCRVCNTDGCNSSARFTLSLMTLLAALFIAIRLH
ncbi:hypothetical protein DMENIID0001_060650 [Sergentomyia squamirostris]